MASVTDKFKKEVETQIEFFDSISKCQLEFENRVIEFKREICITVGQLDYFINYVSEKYHFIP